MCNRRAKKRENSRYKVCRNDLFLKEETEKTKENSLKNNWPVSRKSYRVCVRANKWMSECMHAIDWHKRCDSKQWIRECVRESAYCQPTQRREKNLKEHVHAHKHTAQPAKMLFSIETDWERREAHHEKHRQRIKRKKTKNQNVFQHRFVAFGRRIYFVPSNETIINRLIRIYSVQSLKSVVASNKHS